MLTPRRPPSKKTNSKDSPSSAVGYIRLSTEKQAEGDTAFETQAEKIRKFCAKRGITLKGIFGETWSGADPLGADRRDELAEAVKQARSAASALVVSDPTRLFRNGAAGKEFLDNLEIPVLSVRHGRIMKPHELLREFERGEATVQSIRLGTGKALAQKKADGVEFSTSAVRSRAAAASAKRRAEKAEDIVRQVAHVLQSDPVHRKLTNKALADLLNKRRIRTGWNRSWTQHSVRDARKKAEALVAEWEDVENWDDCLVVPKGDLQPASVTSTLPEPKADAEEDGMAELYGLPTFGMF